MWSGYATGAGEYTLHIYPSSGVTVECSPITIELTKTHLYSNTPVSVEIPAAVIKSFNP